MPLFGTQEELDMARNMITGKETQKMQEYTQEQIDRAETHGNSDSSGCKRTDF